MQESRVIVKHINKIAARKTYLYEREIEEGVYRDLIQVVFCEKEKKRGLIHEVNAIAIAIAIADRKREKKREVVFGY